MNKKSFTIKPIILLFFLTTMISCNNISNSNISLITIPNDSIKGQAIFGEFGSSVPYTPKGKYIQITEPYSGLWRKVIVKNSGKEIKFKTFFNDLDNSVSKIYDSLKYEQYKLKYISDLNDTVVQKVNLTASVDLKFPNELNDYYSVESIAKLDLESLKTNDTLKLLDRYSGCFGGSITHMEFIKANTEKIIFRKRLKNEKSQNNWSWSKVSFEYNNLKELINITKEIDFKDIDNCSNRSDYIFRINNNRTIYWVEDNSCEFDKEITRLLSIN